MFRAYDLKCTNPECAYNFSETLEFPQGTDPTLPKCPKCGTLSEKQLMYGNYTIQGSNSGSTRPNFSKRRK